jgi:hydrogenase expression/formation protein HypD
MRYDHAFRDPRLARRLISQIRDAAGPPVQVMEFCGGHTHAIMRYGIRQALAPDVRLMSGPGCPVCVTADGDIDAAIALAHLPHVTVATFGDMIRVPGTSSSLQGARAQGAEVRIVYSALDALDLARQDPGRSVVMLGIGFETTAPTVAASLLQAHESHIDNYYVYSMHKLTPPAMRAILDAGEVRVDAVIGPGHVTAITGWHAWDFLPDLYGIPCAVSGFEPLDILQAVGLLVRAHHAGQPSVTNPYSRSVTADGNAVAQALMARVFQIAPAEWRGLGEIPDSGFALRGEYAAHDARLTFDLRLPAPEPNARHQACRCGDVLRGLIEPPECPLFGRGCTPERPIGPCMVSAEGSCAAHYRYGETLT